MITKEELDAYLYAQNNSIFTPMSIETWKLLKLDINKYIEIYDYVKGGTGI